ncbi:bifunctional folylpolyglutamate synthase/dihydrofolate synthase [Pseudalkalibacillus berkeleyi]|uniref:tetrahydrofolate synthase n=1 Tax=Pseudalkalibacillus berkeleyi TaxID=1069813 RepID=A0ABS9H2T2_9BACL|nr:folylpolyglutamate synthase/dihydrofolate synthase family protein [Pseudalkalibacillus berkeleyi]MCF6138113.1 bifunctional folylpolyglutamate synthase/dihydrofolate synthase [Pseudalkalibacillus berkeleyi]
MKTYEETLHWIHELLAFGMKPGLSRMEKMLEELGNPEKELTSVHIAGTNGKGSTLTYMRCVLQEAGYTVGTFTSPYIEQFNERISMNGVPIPDQELVAVANEVRPIVEKVAATEFGTPTEFEVVTVLSMVYFARHQNPDIIIFETGLGGRFDSTNVIQPILTAITTIGYDHTAILGETLAEIAFEKSGIMKKNIPMVTGVEQEEALQVIEEQASVKNVELTKLDQACSIFNHMALEQGEQFTLQTTRHLYESLQLKMSGEHQVKNASLAVLLIEKLIEHNEFRISQNDISNGLKQASWPGRFETMSENPLIIVDGAHNKEGIESLKATLKSHYPNKNKRLIFSALKDKPIEEMLSTLYDTIDHITFTSFRFHRASSAESLYDVCTFKKKDLEENFEKAIRLEREKMDENTVLVITGSLYFISTVRNFLKNKK